jgi:hypothetical protein
MKHSTKNENRIERQVINTWLTSPILVRDEFLGPVKGMPLLYLLRHGAASFEGAPGTYPRSEKEFLQRLRDGTIRFCLASIDATGSLLTGDSTFFIPHVLLFPVLIVGSRLMQILERSCELRDSFILPIRPGQVLMHAWHYSIETDRGTESLYRQLYQAIDLSGELPSDSEIVRLVSERYPLRGRLPELYVIVPPSFESVLSIRKQWRQDTLAFSLQPGATVTSPDGPKRISSDYFLRRPLISYEGFLMPADVGASFDCNETRPDLPVLTRKKSVRLEFLEGSDK